MFCRNCGKDVVETAEICPSCGAKPLAGKQFCPACGAPTTTLTEMCTKCGTRLAATAGVASAPMAAAPPMAAMAGGMVAGGVSPKSRLIATLLGWFLMGTGAPRFYSGQIGIAVGQLVILIIGSIVFGLTAFPLYLAAVIWGFVDFLFAVLGKLKDKDGNLIVNWKT